MVTINVKKVPEVCIKLKDKSYICSFNMLCMANMQEALGTFEEDENLANISPAHMCALVLYAGIKANEDAFTIEEAKALAMQIGPGAYGDIIGMFNESVADSMSEKDSKMLKKMIAQKVSNLKK